MKVVVVTSITGGEGKTATAYNLAIAAALAGRRTLLVEGDLRSPSKSEEIGVTPDPNSFREPLLYYGAKSNSLDSMIAAACFCGPGLGKMERFSIFGARRIDLLFAP
ncbi:MAG: tyrosine-protein kinase family protein [Microcystis panniformis]